MSDQHDNHTVVDNWLLELVSQILSFENKKLSSSTSYYYDFIQHGYGTSYKVNDRTKLAQNQIEALLNLLDLIVLNDKLIFDSGWANVWNQSDVLPALKKLLSPIRIGDETKSIIESDMMQNFAFYIDYGYPEIVQDGAMYYLSLARLLSTNYWPSPQRSQFLRQYVYSQIGSGFVLELKGHIDKSIKEAIHDAISPISINTSFLDFSSFGTSILASCESRESILPTAMQLRESSGPTEFRKWLREMDIALQSGNLVFISRSLKELTEVLHSIRAELGLQNDDARNVEFQIGLSPTLTIGSQTAHSMLQNLKRKPYHLTFLRNHLAKTLKNADTWSHISRLFPEMNQLEKQLQTEPKLGRIHKFMKTQ